MSRRPANLLEAAALPENLRLAFLKASRGKKPKREVVEFRASLDAHLTSMREELLAGTTSWGKYHWFRIRDPKERLICAASFPKRVLHHALMNVCEPVFERCAIADSFACRRGKGSLAAVRRAAGFTRRYRFFLKMDVHKYFDSVDHEILRAQMLRLFADPELVQALDGIITAYQKTPGKGLPIGNLTSQHFANHYLAVLDRYVKEQLRCRGYVRYMDDFVLWHDSLQELRSMRDAVRDFLRDMLKLELNPRVFINRTARGIDFLGYRISPRGVRLSRRSKVRFVKKWRACESAFSAGLLTERELQQRITALLAFVLNADTGGWRESLFGSLGKAARKH